MKNKSYVNASEVGEYVYCKRAWWLSFMELVTVSEVMTEGALAHERLSEEEYNYSKYSKFLYITLVIAVILIILVVFYLFTNY